MVSNNIIFFTQLGGILGFIVGLFVLYRMLVETKDATIQLLKERVAALESEVKDAKSKGPDVLAKQLAKRAKLLGDELEQLTKDHERNFDLIGAKEAELTAARDELSALQEQMDRARELMDEFFCPDCGASMVIREYASESVEYGGRELDVDHEYIQFECGRTVVDGNPSANCRNTERPPKPSAF